jgi:predicted nucleotidyltransferase
MVVWELHGNTKGRALNMREADVVTYASLHPQLRKKVLEEQVEIL